MIFKQVFDKKLAQYAYIIGSRESGECIVIDPQRDIDRYIEYASNEGMRIVAAADTHIHADYLSGLREFAERGVKVYASDEGGEDWDYVWLKEGSYDCTLLKSGDKFTVGGVEFEALHTPGHTAEHMTYFVRDLGDGDTSPRRMLSGDFIFVGDVGRPDLLETAAGFVGSMQPAARELWRSIQGFLEMPSSLEIWPGHGAGSVCGKSLGFAPMSTLGKELVVNPSILAAETEDGFVEYILSGQPEPPPYFARMKRDNRLGPKLLAGIPTPAELSSGDLDSLAGRDEIAIVDARPWDEFRDGHLPGALSAPLFDTFNTVVGSYVEEGKEIYLVVSEDEVEEAVLDLIRIGLDDIPVYVTPETLLEYEAHGGTLKTTDEVAVTALGDDATRDGATILDVREASDFDEGHIKGAMNIAYTRLLPRWKEIPGGLPIYVHCRSGRRSAFAAAFLERVGFEVTNVIGGVPEWALAGGEVERGA